MAKTAEEAKVICRDEVLEAFETLHRATERVDFSPAEILAHMRNAGSGYKDSTIRTHVVSHMTDDGTLVRSGPGRYRLSRHRDRPHEPASRPSAVADGIRMSEDQVKLAVKNHLESEGWLVKVAWGRERGIDVEASRGPERMVIEAKGQAPAGPQQVNYFLNALGELVQRMDDPDTVYGLALPDHRQYRGLVDRLPEFARQHLRLQVWFVDVDGSVSWS